MRVQIYEEELGEGVEVVTKVAEGGVTFYGLRFWLKTCQPLLDHSTAEDDDRSAITFWGRNLRTLWAVAYDAKLAVAAAQEKYPEE